MRYSLLIIFFLTALWLRAAAPAAETLIQQADNAFRQGTELMSKDPAAAQRHWEAARLRYEQLYQNPDLRSGPLCYNLGNTYARLGDYGHAILYYRRALNYTPHALDLRANLQYVRSLRADHFADSEPAKVLKTLFFWHYDLSAATRSNMALAAATLFWIAAAALLWKRPLWLKITAASAAVIAVIFAASLATDWWTNRGKAPAVIIATEVRPLKGDSESYAPAFDAPIHSGTEIHIINARGDWLEIQLPNGLTGWIKNSTAKAI